MDAAGSVRFDFEGSLDLARSLWRLAEELDQLLASRAAMASTALTGWTGRFGEQFAERANDEQSTGRTLAQMLRADAQGWALAWTRAMDEQNRVLYAREKQRVESDRGLLDSLGGAIFGHDDLPAMPRPASVPQPPYFFATRSFARY
jgi:hypothetical protein